MEMNRFDSIMARVDAWAAENAGWDCRAEAVAEAEYILSHPVLCAWDEDRIVESAIYAWQCAE